MKNKIISLLLATLIVLSINGCGSSVVADAETEQEQVAMFERHKLDKYYSILVHKETGVCYLEYEATNSISGHTYYGITVMLNADGTPKIWKED